MFSWKRKVNKFLESSLVWNRPHRINIHSKLYISHFQQSHYCATWSQKKFIQDNQVFPALFFVLVLNNGPQLLDLWLNTVNLLLISVPVSHCLHTHAHTHLFSPVSGPQRGDTVWGGRVPLKAAWEAWCCSVIRTSADWWRTVVDMSVEQTYTATCWSVFFLFYPCVYLQCPVELASLQQSDLQQTDHLWHVMGQRSWSSGGLLQYSNCRIREPMRC